MAALAGFGTWAAADHLLDDDGERAVRHNNANAFTVDATATAPTAPSPAPVAPLPFQGGATGPAAVEGYLLAEATGDTTASYTFLSVTDRQQYPTAALWERARADRFPIVAFDIVSVAGDDSRVTVETELRLEPILDEVIGNVPARALGTWVALRDGAGWYVSLADSSLEPLWPSDDGAATAASSWAAARQRCGDTRENEYATLVGSPSLADELCGATTDIEVGPAEPMEAIDATPVVAAFGDTATAWARVVSVRGAASMRAVVAPLGDDWVVVGVLPPID